MNKKKEWVILILSIVCFFVLSVSFLFMPFENTRAEEGFSIISHLSGLAFWISLLLAVVFQIWLAVCRRKSHRKNRTRSLNCVSKAGVFSFFKNKTAKVFDYLMIASFTAFIAAMLITRGTGYICYVLVSVFVFSFCMHCIFNGKIYAYVTDSEQTRRAVGKYNG